VQADGVQLNLRDRREWQLSIRQSAAQMNATLLKRMLLLCRHVTRLRNRLQSSPGVRFTTRRVAPATEPCQNVSWAFGGLVEEFYFSFRSIMDVILC
jgi:hypothetical protein